MTNKVACNDAVNIVSIETILTDDKLKIISSILMIAIVIYPPAKNRREIRYLFKASVCGSGKVRKITAKPIQPTINVVLTNENK